MELPRLWICEPIAMQSTAHDPLGDSYDRGAKFSAYRDLPSVEEYVLVSQSEPLIETFLRQAD